MYVTSWFMCLFTTLPCWDTVLTICDLLFLEGKVTIHIHWMFPVVNDSCCSVDTLEDGLEKNGEEEEEEEIKGRERI